MSIMYLAKINLTSAIYDVYDNKININDVTQSVYDQLNENTKYSMISNRKYKDSLGNTKKFHQNSIYQLTELNKCNDMIITGKMVRTFYRPTERINEHGKVISDFNTDNVSIYFYFDVKNELVAFSERQSFGYNQFILALNYMINQNKEKYKFEIFLQKDNNILQEKIKELKSVYSIRATLIPPNSNEEDLKEFRESLQYIEDCKSMNANKLRLEMSVDNELNSLKIESKYMQDIFKAVSRGYGDVTTNGINQNGKKQTISSNQDAALTRIVDENLTEPEYAGEAHNFIINFLQKKVRGIKYGK